jgi:hypothetical protein
LRGQSRNIPALSSFFFAESLVQCVYYPGRFIDPCGSKLEPAFMNYLRAYFDDEGMPYLGDALANSQSEVSLFDVTLDLKRELKPDLYQHLICTDF